RAAPSEEEIAQAVRRLGDKSFSVREKATQWLLAAGPEVKPALRQALRSSDPEVVRRARAILGRLKQQLPPGTPETIAKLIAECRSGSPDQGTGAYFRLALKGGRWYPVLLDLVADEEDPRSRQQVLRGLGRDLPKMAAWLVAEGRPAEAQELVEAHLAASR